MHFEIESTIAEYVENEEIARRLTALGVDYAQGYGLHRPQPLVLDAPVAENSPS